MSELRNLLSDNIRQVKKIAYLNLLADTLFSET